MRGERADEFCALWERIDDEQFFAYRQESDAPNRDYTTSGDGRSSEFRSWRSVHRGMFGPNRTMAVQKA